MTLHPSQFEYHSRVQFQAGIASWLLVGAAWGLLGLGCYLREPISKAVAFGGVLLVGAAARPIRKIAIATERLSNDTQDLSHTSLQRWLFEEMKPQNTYQAQTHQDVGQAILEPVTALPTYDLSEIGEAFHTMIVGPTGSGKSVLVQYLVSRYFSGSDVRVYDSDATPDDWPGLPVIGRGGDFLSISGGMVEDLRLLEKRCDLRSRGERITTEAVRVCEEFPAVAAELSEGLEGGKKKDSCSASWLKRLARRGRKYRIKLILVTQETEVAAMGIEGEGGVRKAFTIIYLGAAALEVASRIRDKELQQSILKYLNSCNRPCLVDHRGRWFATAIPDLSGVSYHQARSIPDQPNPTPISFDLRNDETTVRNSSEMSQGKALDTLVSTLGTVSNNPENTPSIAPDRKKRVLEMKSLGMSQTQILKVEWGVTPGSSSRYTQGVTEYKNIIGE